MLVVEDRRLRTGTMTYNVPPHINIMLISIVFYHHGLHLSWALQLVQVINPLS
jgi:hypothetical protein